MNFIPRPNTKTPNVVAIDPDLNASGVAAWCNQSRTWLFAKSISIESILDSLKDLKPEETTVYVECGWMNKKANFRKSLNAGHSENIAMKVGQNHAAGKLIIKLLEGSGYTVEKFKPLRKGIFKDETGWTRHGREYVEKESGLSHRMNDDVRDAIFTVLHFR
jgi:hypothetical protein